MVHGDFQISMRSLHLIMLFTPVGYMSMICLTKFLSRLVGVWLRSCRVYFFCFIFFPILYLILSFHSILGSGLGFGPEKLAEILGSLAQNWQVWSTIVGM